MKKQSNCAACGMACEPREYHPYLACYAYKNGLSSEAVRGNLAGVVAFGMRATKSKVSVHTACTDITKVRVGKP